MTLSSFGNIIGWNKFQVSVTGDGKPHEPPRFAILDFVRPRRRNYIYTIPEAEAATRHQSPIVNLTPCFACKLAMGSQRTLRGITVATFIPGFAICVAHGAVTSEPLPAVGVIPQFFSAVLGIVMLASTSKGQPLKLKHRARADNDPESQLSPDVDDDDDELHVQHPILLFFADTILATLFLILLIVTFFSISGWHGYYYDDGLTVLASYGTVAMMVNFCIHAYLALRSFLIGTGLIRFFQYLFSLGAPLDCPHCGNHFRSSGVPRAPWFKSLSVPSVPSFRESGSAFVSARATKDWKAPTWLKGGARSEGEPLLAEEGRAQQMYKDDYDEDAVAVKAATAATEAGEGSAS